MSVFHKWRRERKLLAGGREKEKEQFDDDVSGANGKGCNWPEAAKELIFQKLLGGEELKFAEMRINGYIAAESFGNYWPAL